MKKPRKVELAVGDRVEYTGSKRTRVLEDGSRDFSLSPGDVGAVTKIHPPIPSTGQLIDDDIEPFIDPGSDGCAIVHFESWGNVAVKQTSIDKGYFRVVDTKDKHRGQNQKAKTK